MHGYGVVDCTYSIRILYVGRWPSDFFLLGRTAYGQLHFRLLVKKILFNHNDLLDYVKRDGSKFVRSSNVLPKF